MNYRLTVCDVTPEERMVQNFTGNEHATAIFLVQRSARRRPPVVAAMFMAANDMLYPGYMSSVHLYYDARWVRYREVYERVTGAEQVDRQMLNFLAGIQEDAVRMGICRETHLVACHFAGSLTGTLKLFFASRRAEFQDILRGEFRSVRGFLDQNAAVFWECGVRIRA